MRSGASSNILYHSFLSLNKIKVYLLIIQVDIQRNKSRRKIHVRLKMILSFGLHYTVHCSLPRVAKDQCNHTLYASKNSDKCCSIEIHFHFAGFQLLCVISFPIEFPLFFRACALRDHITQATLSVQNGDENELNVPYMEANALSLYDNKLRFDWHMILSISSLFIVLYASMWKCLVKRNARRCCA